MSIKIDNEEEQNLRSWLKEIITQKIKSQSIALSTEKSIEEIATEEDDEQNLRSRLKKGIIQTTEPLSITQTPFIEEMESDKEDEETETDKEIVETTEEQKERRKLIHARRELLHVYSKHTMDNDEEQTEQDKTDMYPRTSTEEEQKPLPQEEYDEDEPFKEHDDKEEWTTQSSHLTNEEENALFIAFINRDVEV